MVFASDSSVAQGKAIGEIKARLGARFSDRSPAEVARIVDEVTGRFTTARIREYVPLLVERISRDELSHRFSVKRWRVPSFDEPVPISVHADADADAVPAEG